MDLIRLKEQLNSWSELHFLSPAQIDRLAELLDDAGKGGILYPSILKKEMKVSLTVASELLKFLRHKEILEGTRVIMCPHCHKTSVIHSTSLSSYLQLQKCPYCNKTITLPEDTFILYRRPLSAG